MLKSGDKAPNFEMPNADMEVDSLADYHGKMGLVLYFYPKDDTPGCTIESIDFSEMKDDFKALNYRVLGISRDTCLSHSEFRDKHGLSIRLLADIDGVMCRAYDVWREKEAHGKIREGIMRSTFVVDQQGIIRHALYDVKPMGHAAEILKLIEAL